jgi:hypothetical protein
MKRSKTFYGPYVDSPAYSAVSRELYAQGFSHCAENAYAGPNPGGRKNARIVWVYIIPDGFGGYVAKYVGADARATE